jgi:hypothetical protein
LPWFLLLIPAGRPAIAGLGRQSRSQRQQRRDRQNGATKCVGIFRLLQCSPQCSLWVPPRRHGQKHTRSAWMAGSTPALCIAISRISSNAGPRRQASADPAARTRNTNPLHRRSATAPRGGVIRRLPAGRTSPYRVRKLPGAYLARRIVGPYTLIIRLPRFSPASNPISAFGVFSRPSMMSSWTFSLPAATQDCRSFRA